MLACTVAVGVAVMPPNSSTRAASALDNKQCSLIAMLVRARALHNPTDFVAAGGDVATELKL